MKCSRALVAAAIVLCVCLSGCSVLMAAKQPGRKSVKLFKPGTPRKTLLAEFGYPAESGARAGKRYEVFRFTQGYSLGARAGRAALHGAADVLTLGLWETVGTPTEEAADGAEMAYGVLYDRDDVIEEVTLLKRVSR